MATGDGAAVSQIIAAAAETLNQGTGFGGLGESMAGEMIETRAALADLLCQSSADGGSGPEANAARGSALSALAESPQVNVGLLSSGDCVLQAMVRTTEANPYSNPDPKP